MSVRVQTYVWQLTLPPIQKLIAIALADHCHDDGSEARPSQMRLMEKTGLSERTVRDGLKGLVQAGILTLERPSGQHRPNCYMFLMPEGFATVKKGAADAPLAPEGQTALQRGSSRRSEGHDSPPNHKEPLVETTADLITISDLPDLAEVRRRNDDIFGRRRAQ